MARYKDSTVDLILKGHFENLKRDVNIEFPNGGLLEDVKRYLSKQKDAEAQKLLQRIKGYEEQPLFKQKPMQRAGKSKQTMNRDKKTG